MKMEHVECLKFEPKIEDINTKAFTPKIIYKFIFAPNKYIKIPVTKPTL